MMVTRVNHPVLPGGLSADDHERIHELAEQGWASPRIAREIQKHPSTVYWFMCRAGLSPPRQTGTAKAVTRGAGIVRRFTREEDAFIHALRLEGYALKPIAEMTSQHFGHSRSPGSILCRLRKLATLEGDVLREVA